LSPCDGIDEWMLIGAFVLAAKTLLPCFKEDINNFGFVPLLFLFPFFFPNPPPPPLPPPPPKESVVPISKPNSV